MFNYSQHPGKTTWASRTLHFVGSAFMRLFFRIRIETTSGFPKDGPLLILSKHTTELDIPIGYAAMQTVLKRRAWCVMKASLARSRYLGFFWKIGGIPLDRERPEKSKQYLIYARKVLYDLDWTGKKEGTGNVLVLFPEETTYPRRMGEGQAAGFRFITGKPVEPLNVLCAGFSYRRGFPRGDVLIRFGPVRQYSREVDPGLFLHERMMEIASLSALEYPFEAPRARTASASANG